MSTDNFGPAPDGNFTPPPPPGYTPPPGSVPPPPDYGAVPPVPPTPGYGQSGPPPAPTPGYGQVPPAPFPPQPPVPGAYPAPYNAGGFQPPLASFGKRCYGALIDWVPIWIVGGISGAIGSSALTSLLSLAAFAYAIYNIGYLGGTTGVTFGRKLAGTRLVSEQTMQPIGAGAGIGRYFLHIIDALICCIGFLFPLWTPKNQTIADMIIKSIVIEDA